MHIINEELRNMMVKKMEDNMVDFVHRMESFQGWDNEAFQLCADVAEGFMGMRCDICRYGYVLERTWEGFKGAIKAYYKAFPDEGKETRTMNPYSLGDMLVFSRMFERISGMPS